MQTDRWRVVLDSNQQYLGKAFVTLVEHKESLSDLSTEDWNDFELLVKKLESAVKSAFKPNHFNWSCLMNIAAMNGQPTHVHWHMHPRYSQVVEVAGEPFEDTKWYPRSNVTDCQVDRQVLQEIADIIIKNI